MAESPRLKSAQERLIQAGARIDQARAEAGPTIGATAGLRIQTPTVRITLPDGRTITVVQLLTGQAGLSATLPIDTSGRISAGKRVAVFGAQAALEDMKATAQQLLLDVTTAYYGVLNAQSARRAVEAQVVALTERLRVTSAQADAGLATALDALQVADRLASSRDRLAAATEKEAVARGALNALLARPTDAPVEITSPSISDWEVPTLEASLKRADAAKPELVALRERLKQAEAGVDAAKSGRKPSLRLDMGALIQTPTSFIPAFGAQFGLGLFQSIFDRGKVRAAIAEAEAVRRELSAQYTEFRDTLGVQIQSALATVHDRELTRKTAHQILATAERATRAARAAQAQGLRTRADVLDAELRLEETREAAVAADYAATMARVEWARTAGALDLPFFQAILSDQKSTGHAGELNSERMSSP